jgi:large subunit ribosomal protein L1
MAQEQASSVKKEAPRMPKLSKRFKLIKEKALPGKIYPVQEAISLLRDCPPAKFVESVDVSVRLGVDPRKSDQVVRGATVLPHGLGRTVKVAVFAEEGEAADEAKKAGADIVGFEDLVQSVKGGNLDFDVVIATPSAMRTVSQLGQVLGPRGLMPNPKLGTVTKDLSTAVQNAKKGQVRYRTEKAGIVHCSIGRVDFKEKALVENLEALMKDLKKAKPEAAKGVYFKKIILSTTMGPGLEIDLASLNI